MSLSQQLEQQLAAAGTGACTLSPSDGGEKLVCELATIDSLGVSVRRLELQSPRLAGKSIEQLKAISSDLARRVSYLLEAIAAVEIDNEACAIQMRSTPPYRQENATSYYEVLVTAGTISLRRYKKGRREARQPEPYAITREVLFRLVDDFSAAAAG